MTDRVTPRRNEGHRLATQKVPLADVGAGTSIGFGLDFSDAPVPARRYIADICDLRVLRDDLLIVFGQEAVFGGGIDSALQIRMSASSCKDFLRTVETMPGVGLDEILIREKLSREPLTPLSVKPVHEAKVVANFISCAIAGGESCMDFYHASAFSFRQLGTHGDLDVEPIVRVDLHTSLFASLIDRMKALIPSLLVGSSGE